MARLLDSETLFLDQDGHSDLANIATDNEITTDKLKALSTDRLNALKAEVDKMRIQDATKPELKALLEEAIKQKGTSVLAAPAVATPTKGIIDKPPAVPRAINESAVDARKAMEKMLNPKNRDLWHNFGGFGSADYMNFWRQIKSIVPGFEPSNINDASDFANQGKTTINGLIDYLITESTNETKDIGGKHTINLSSSNPTKGVWWYTSNTDNRFNTMSEKQDAIKKILGDATKKMDEVAEDGGWEELALFLGISIATFKVAKIASAISSIPKVGGKASSILGGTGELTVDGAKKDTRGPHPHERYPNRTRERDLVDNPPYTPDEWAKERARLEETTRRMIYMDSGVNPRHNPAATPAEIFTAVEGTPALKTAYDARMVKLTELSHTLVGQEKYLSPKAFDKESARIIAGDIGEGSVRKTILKKVPFTAERSDFKSTQAALKKVKGEIDTMRARLSAKSTIDGVEIPKVLETQVKAFEAAYQAAYQADLTVDKARNTIDRTITQANAMGDMVTLFGEIEELKQKIGDDTKGLTKKINDLDTKIASNSNAAHSENPSEQRQREAEGKQGEITAANEVKQQAIREGDSHDTAKKEALRDKRSAEEAVLDEEARIRKEISDRKTSLQDQITKNSGDATKATAITAWQDELDGKIGKVKDFTEYLTPPHTGSTLVAKKQAVTDAGNVLTDLVNKDIGVSRKIADAQNEVMRLGNEKTAILSRATGANVASLTTTDQAELARLKSEKSGLEDKIKEKKATIDTIATKLENKFSLNSRSGTKALAEAEFNRLQALVTPAPAGGVAGTLVSAKDTAKTARNLAFIDLNTAADTLNAEAARLGAGLDVKVPHISEFRKGQGYGDDLSMRENGVAGDKAADHKMKPAKSAIKTVLTRGH